MPTAKALEVIECIAGSGEHYHLAVNLPNYGAILNLPAGPSSRPRVMSGAGVQAVTVGAPPEAIAELCRCEVGRGAPHGRRRCMATAMPLQCLALDPCPRPGYSAAHPDDYLRPTAVSAPVLAVALLFILGGIAYRRHPLAASPIAATHYTPVYTRSALMPFGPIDTTSSPYAHWRAIPLDGCTFAEGFWTQRQRINRTVSLRHGYRQLERHGNFNNLRLAAGTGTGEYRRPVFMDSDVYKWLEAVAYDLVAAPDPELEQMAAAAIDLVAAAQMPDGYLDSYWQVVEPDRRWADHDHGHELYCAGHLIQAAVAFYRATGQDRLLRVAQRFADHIDIVFGPGKQQGTPGHPEIETALVELYRFHA